MAVRQRDRAAARLDGADGRLDVQRREPHGWYGQRRRPRVLLEAFLQHEDRLAGARLVRAAVERGDHEEVPELADRVGRLATFAQPLLKRDVFQAPALVDLEETEREERAPDLDLLAPGEVAVAKERRGEVQSEGQVR